MLDMEDPVISDNLSLIAEKVRGIAETIWGYDEIGEGKRGIAIMRRVLAENEMMDGKTRSDDEETQ